MAGTQPVVARDYGSPDRGPTVLTPPEEHPQDRAVTPQSPASPMEYPKLERRGSANSRLSAPGSPEGLRNRRLTRIGTVKKFPDNVQEIPSVDENYYPGAEPGIDTTADDDKIPEHLTSLKTQCDINIIDYSDQDVHHLKADNMSLADALKTPRTEALPCRWISVNGLSWDVIKTLGNKFHLHRLAIEDLMHTHTRTKVDWYADHAFIVLTLQKLVRLHQHKGSNDKCNCTGASDYDSDEYNEKHPQKQFNRQHWWDWFMGKRQPDVLPRYLDRNRDGKMDEFISAHSGLSDTTPVKPIRTLHRYESAQIPEHTAWMERHSALMNEDMTVSVEQVAIFLLSDNAVISFFEHSAEDIETPILDRLSSKETMLRRSCDASLLTQAIIDAIVDLAVPVRDAYNKARKELQIDAMTNPDIKTSRALHIFGEEVDMLQNLFKPIVHLVNSLRDHHTDTPMSTNATPIPTPAPYATASEPPMPSGGSVPSKTVRNRDGMVRHISDFRKIALKRADEATSVTITPLAHTYFGDVLDHCITMISALEQMDASANNISTLIFNTVGAKTNNFMMILAVVTVFFAPLTFISGECIERVPHV